MKKLLIIGAGFLQDFVICKAKAMGYKVLAVDADPCAPGFRHADQYSVINITDEQACFHYAKENEIDGVLTAATDYGVLTSSYIAEHMGLPGLEYKVAQLIKDKYRVRRCLFESQVDDINQFYTADNYLDITALSQQLKYPVIVKPRNGSGSRGVIKADNRDQLQNAYIYAINNSKTYQVMIESFASGDEFGVESFVLNGQIHVLAIMKKWMTAPPYYAELGHAIPSGLSEIIEKKVIRSVHNAISALGINFGAVNIDLIITASGNIHIVDIGTRMGGNLIGPYIIPYGTGIDYVGAVIRSSLGESIDLSAGKKTPVATKLLTFSSGIIKKVPDMKKVEKQYGVEIFHHLSEGEATREYHTNLDGYGYIVARDDTVSAAEKKAKQALEMIRKEAL